jgi:PmbA protein
MEIDRNYAADVVERARRRGATAAEVILRSDLEFEATVRLGNVETVNESASTGLGIRVLVDGRQASVSSTDLSWATVDTLIEDAISMARASSVDEEADLPEKSALVTELPELDLHDAKIDELSNDQKLELALRGEQAALDTDPRVVNSDRGGAGTQSGKVVLANSLGFAGEYRVSSVWVIVVPVVEQNGTKERDHWYDVRRHLSDLEQPESIGRKAAERALRRLGGRKVETCEVPVVFEPEVGRDLVTTICSAASGESVYRTASLFVNQLDSVVAAPCVSIIDDGRMVRGLGSRPFDAEGLATRRTEVIGGGVLKNYLLNTYTGRKLGRSSTGNAVRGLVGAPTVGPGNAYLAGGDTPAVDLLASVKRGMLVTEVIGFGVNIVNGDYSRGACGMWIENGVPAFPVHEVTIASNLRDILRGVAVVGNDLQFQGRFGAPTLLIENMAISGT